MRTFCVGDVHGCYDELKALLDSVAFDPKEDLLLATGDIIGRGPRPLETIRLFMSLGKHAIAVQGNHDLSLLRNYSIWRNLRDASSRDKFVAGLKSRELGIILAQDDREEIFTYLRSNPMCYSDPARRILLTHAGLSPEWTVSDALIRGAEVERVLRSDRFDWFMSNMFADKPDSWAKIIKADARLRRTDKLLKKDTASKSATLELKRLIYSVNALTRMRFCREDLSLEFLCKDGPEAARSQGLYPWYEKCTGIAGDETVIFGHWAALQGQCPRKNIIALDTGCVWKGSLTMTNLDNLRIRHTVAAG